MPAYRPGTVGNLLAMSTSGPTVPVQQQLSPLRMMVLAMGLVLPIIGVLSWFIHPHLVVQRNQVLLAIGIGAAGPVLAHLMTRAVLPPLAPDVEDPLRAGMQRLQSATFTQLSLAEAGGLVVFALAFVLEFGPIPVLAGTVVAAIGLFLVVWPGRARLRRARRLLESGGASCPIDELAEQRR